MQRTGLTSVRRAVLLRPSTGLAPKSFARCSSDRPEEVDATWLPIRPGTDVALMLALAPLRSASRPGLREWRAECPSAYTGGMMVM